MCLIVLKTQIQIRPQPLVDDLSVVCVIWVISIEAECYIYAGPKATQTVCSRSASNPETTLRRYGNG